MCVLLWCYCAKSTSCLHWQLIDIQLPLVFSLLASQTPTQIIWLNQLKYLKCVSLFSSCLEVCIWMERGVRSGICLPKIFSVCFRPNPYNNVSKPPLGYADNIILNLFDVSVQRLLCIVKQKVQVCCMVLWSFYNGKRKAIVEADLKWLSTHLLVHELKISVTYLIVVFCVWIIYRGYAYDVRNMFAQNKN